MITLSVDSICKNVASLLSTLADIVSRKMKKKQRVWDTPPVNGSTKSNCVPFSLEIRVYDMFSGTMTQFQLTAQIE